MRFDRITGPRWGRCRKRRAVSDVVATLLMTAVVVSLGVLAFTFASTGLGSLTQNFGGLMSNQGNAVAEKFVVEQVAFTTSTLAIDGSATGCFGGATQSAPCTAGTSSGAATLTTAGSTDVFVVEVANENVAGAVLRTVSNIACTSSCPTGLTSFARVANNTITSSPYDDAEVYWASATGAATSMVITVTLTGATSDASIVAFGVSGANTASPWDSNVALPALAKSTSGTTAPSVSGVSTSNAADMILGFSGILDSSTNVPPTETAGSGFTLIATQNDGGGTGKSEAAAEYNVVSATQSSLTVAFGTAVLSNNGWIMIGDAIKAATASTPGADVYVRNVGSIASTLVSVYIVDQSTSTFVEQVPLTAAQGALNVGTVLDISHTLLTFTTLHGHTYSFTVTSSLGNSVIYNARAA